MHVCVLDPNSPVRLQVLLKNAGVNGQKTVLLLTDTQIKDEAFLEDVDSVLNTGEVPNLFAAEERQVIIEVGRDSSWPRAKLLLHHPLFLSSLSLCRQCAPLP